MGCEHLKLRQLFKSNTKDGLISASVFFPSGFAVFLYCYVPALPGARIARGGRKRVLAPTALTTSELFDQLMPLADRSLTVDKLPNRYDEHFIKTSRRDSEIIFQECLAYSWNALEKTPSLIAASRARDELKLYFQALEFLNMRNEYVLGGHNFPLFKTMPGLFFRTFDNLASRELTPTRLCGGLSKCSIDELNLSNQEISAIYKYFRSFPELIELTIYVFSETWNDWEDER